MLFINYAETVTAVNVITDGGIVAATADAISKFWH